MVVITFVIKNTEQMIATGSPAEKAAAEAVAPITGTNNDGSFIRKHKDVTWNQDSEAIEEYGVAVPNRDSLLLMNYMAVN